MPPKNQKNLSGDTVNNDKTKPFRAWVLAGELGYMIAIPIVIFALIGRFADRFFDTSPWLLLIGILISIFTSTWLIYRKVKEVM